MATVNEHPEFYGTGATRKEAETAAALDYVLRTGDDPDDGPVTEEEMARYLAADATAQREIAAGRFIEIRVD